MSPLAILVAAIFWTWLWGPVGLLLATPLTVCAAVAGRYTPSLRFLAILLSDEPVLSPENRFYQRLLAMDADEAVEVAEQFLKETKSLEDLYDHVIVPALSLAEADRHRGGLDEERCRFVMQSTRFIVEDIAERADDLLAEKPVQGNGKLADRASARQRLEPPTEVSVLSIPAWDEADEVGALMLALLLKRRGVGVKPLAAALASERLEEAGRAGIRVACVVAVPPFGLMHVRYLCKRLRTDLPQVKVIAGVLSEGDPAETRKGTPAVPADELSASLKQTVAEVLALIPERAAQAAFSS